MKVRYIINGWEEGMKYFFSLCSPSEEEYNRMIDGEAVVKGKNEFRIEVVERR